MSSVAAALSAPRLIFDFGHPGRARGDQAAQGALRAALAAVEGVGVYIGTMKTRLDRAGAKPAFDSPKIGARFYRGTQVGETSQVCRPAEWIGG